MPKLTLYHTLRLGAFVALGVATISCDDTQQPPATFAAADSADQIMFGVRVAVTRDGVMQAMIEADTAFQYEALQLTELRTVTVHFYNSLGERTSTLTSEEATFEWRSENMEARRNVVALTPDNRKLTTEILRYNKLRHQIEGSSAFVYDTPSQHFEGDAFTSDPDFRNVEAVRPRGTLGNLDLDQ